MEYYFAHMRFVGARFDFSRLEPVIVPIFDFLKKHDYAVSMLGDVSSTTALVRSIILERLHLSKWKMFHGLDLGTWSWILALAQYIMARRNGFINIRIDGIEQNVHAARQAEMTLRSFVPGGTFHIHGADATKQHGYRKVTSTPDFVSIEMIPFAGTDMIISPEEKSWTNINPDPFIPTLLALTWKIKQLIDATFFPHSIRTQVHLTREQISWVHDFSLSGEAGLINMCSFAQSVGFFDGIGRLSVDDIKISSAQDFLSLPDIGTHLLDLSTNPNWWVKPLYVWRHRWRKIVEHNPKYKRLLDLFNSASPEKKKEVPVMPPLVWRDTVTH